MACEFKYKGEGFTLSSQNIEGIVQLLLFDSTGQQIRNISDITIDSLNFFNADADKVSLIIAESEKATSVHGHTSVTEFISNFLRVNKKGESAVENVGGVVSETLKENADDYVDYRADYGSKMHNVVDALNKFGKDSTEYSLALDSLWATILAGKARAGKWSGVILGGAAPTIKFLNSLPSTNEEFCQKYLFNAILKILDTLKEKTPNIKTEVRFEDQKAHGGNGLTGVIDAVTWDNNGNVIIWDFKTTYRDDVSLNTKLYRYLQLKAYKEMLIRKGVPSDKIKIMTLQITDSVINGDLPNISVLAIDPESVFNSDQFEKVREKETTILRIFYPFTGKTLTEQEQNAKKQKIERAVSPILSKLGISRISVESQMNRLKERIENGTPTFVRQILESEWKKGVTIAKWKKDGDLIIGYDASGKLLIKDTLENIAKKEAQAIHDKLNVDTRSISYALQAQSYNGLLNFFKYKEKHKNALLCALEPYISDQYEYQQIPFLEDNYNIITMKNRADNTYSFIVLSEVAGLSHKRNGMHNMLDPVFADESILKKFKEAKDLPEPTAENLLTLQAMVVISQCRDILSDLPIKIDNIQVVSTFNGTHSRGTNIAQFSNAFKLLQYLARTNKASMQDPEAYENINDDWENNVSLSDPKDVLFRLVINRISTFKFTNPDALLDGLDSLTVEKIINNLSDLLDGLRKEHGSECFNAKSQIGRIYAGLLLIKKEYLTGQVEEKLYKNTRYGLTAAETLGAGLDLFKYALSKRFSFNGMIVLGIAQGLDTSVSYSNPDKSIALYELIFRQAARLITVELNDLAIPLNLATKKFLREAGKSLFKIAVLGSTTDVYELLFEQDNGKIAKNMLLKNPYSDFSELADFLKEYAKEVLWAINRLRMKEAIDPIYRKMSYKEFELHKEAHDKYKEMINNNSEYLEMPLKLRNSAEGVFTNIHNLFNIEDSDEETRGRIKRFCQSLQQRWLLSIEPTLLTPDQASLMDLDINESERDFRYRSPYNKQGENRVSLLENTPINEWEKNLNILTLEYACALFKEIYFLEVLHTVGNLLGEIDLMEVMTGNDLTKTKLALIDRVKISVYNRNLVDDELKTLAAIVSGIKRVVSFTKLSLRPATFIKEMILGALRNSSTILLENFINDNPITFDHLLKAAGIVYTNGLFINEGFAPDDETFGDFRLVGALNNLYRINDRDLNLLGESISYDSHGIMHWGSRMLYLNTTSPDWFNRMTILVAKMMADGTWEAHSLDKDGRLLYDPLKDKRFKRFLSFYKSHPDLKEEPTDEEYIMSKARYTMTVEQLKREGYKDLVASDGEGYSIIPICYTSQEMDSVKEQIGMLYGYYSQEERSTVQKGIAWLLHTQFLTFLPGEIKKYFASGNFESSVGKVVHQTEPFTGKKLYYITNDAGLTEIVNEDELTTDQKTRPVMEFVKTPLEGLLVSTIKTFSQVYHGDRANITKEQLNRTKLFFFNMLVWALIHALIIMLGISVVKDKKASKDDKKKIDAVAAGMRILTSVSNEMNIFNVLESSLSTMGITGYDTMKQMMASTMHTLVSNPEDYFSILNQMGAINDFQIR